MQNVSALDNIVPGFVDIDLVGAPQRTLLSQYSLHHKSAQPFGLRSEQRV